LEEIVRFPSTVIVGTRDMNGVFRTMSERFSVVSFRSDYRAMSIMQFSAININLEFPSTEARSIDLVGMSHFKLFVPLSGLSHICNVIRHVMSCGIFL